VIGPSVLAIGKNVDSLPVNCYIIGKEYQLGIRRESLSREGKEKNARAALLPIAGGGETSNGHPVSWIISEKKLTLLL